MSRLLPFALVFAAACGKSASSQDKASTAPPGGGEKISVPGGKGGPQIAAEGGTDGAQVTGAPDTALSDATKARAQDPRFHLKPEEGTLTIDAPPAKAGAEATAAIKLAPSAGHKLATDFPIKLWLEAPSGVKIAKSYMTAGGRSKVQGDAQTLTEQALAFDVKATPEAAGAYEITGVFMFGICEKDSCHPKTQPITIKVAAN
jgi:hypothetical protein